MLLDCPECGGTLSSKAESCPHCGYVLNPSPTNQIFGFIGCCLKAAAFLFAVLLLLALCSREGSIERVQARRAPSPLPQFKTARASTGKSVVGASARRGKTRGVTGTPGHPRGGAVSGTSA